MKAKLLIAVLLSLCLALTLSVLASAQEKGAAKKSDEDRVSGTIQNVSKDTSTLSVRTRQGIIRPVVWNADTKITKDKEAGKLEELKEGVRIIALGKFNEKNQLVATQIDIREPR
jgi:hypothetical protein